MKDVELGTGPTKYAWPAQITGSSTILEFVFPSLINAIPLTGQEPVFPAMKATT